jgi:hypothetical protein
MSMSLPPRLIPRSGPRGRRPRAFPAIAARRLSPICYRERVPQVRRRACAEPPGPYQDADAVGMRRGR